MKPLENGITAAFEPAGRERWRGIISLFRDANLYQTWSYDSAGGGNSRIEHMVLGRKGEVLAAAQARIVQVPVFRSGISYIFWGPLWLKKGINQNREVFRQAIRALKNEYAVKRGLVLRIYPRIYRSENGEKLKQILIEEGYHAYEEKVRRTLIVDLSPTIDELRAALDQKWRNCLNRAERNGLEIITGENLELFDELSSMYLEMATRKGLTELTDIQRFKMAQSSLEPEHRLKVIICRLEGTCCAGGIFSAIGNSGVYLCGATSNPGMKTNGSYAVQWTFVKWLKDKGFEFYDLNGINPIVNPGTYHFKRGLAGKRGHDIELLGKYQASGSWLSNAIVKGSEEFRNISRSAPEKAKAVISAMKTRVAKKDNVAN